MSILEILLVASVLPSALLMMLVYQNDKTEKEPENLLIKLFFMGIVSAIIAMIGESIAELIIPIFIAPESELFIFVQAFFMVALVEECAKFLMLKLSSWKESNFNYTFDAIVYAVFVSLGFATIENILYVLSNGLLVAILRAVSSIPGHMSFGLFMGIYYGRAKLCEKRNDIKRKNYNLMMSIFVPVLLHGLFDYCLMKSTAISLICFVILLIFIYVNMFVRIKKHSREDEKIHNEDESEKLNQVMNENIVK